MKVWYLSSFSGIFISLKNIHLDDQVLKCKYEHSITSCFFAEVRGILNIRSCASLEYSRKNMSVKGQYLCPISMCPPNTAISL